MQPIECHNVWKKYTKGEKINSLRDLIPGLTKAFFKQKQTEDELTAKEFWALKDVTFDVRRGEVLGIIGPNGAGKSTILKLLSKIIRPNKGTFAVNGRLSALIEITAGFHPEFTGRENVYFNGSILGMSKRELDEKFDQIVDFSGVEEFIDTPVKRYSSGMYARLGFAVAAHVNPDILLVDEVLAVGDINFQAKCAQKMRELLKSGTTIALVSHNIPLVQNICSRVVLLNHGELIRTGPADDVIPFYQNIVTQKNEEELKRKFAATADRLQIQEKSPVQISEVRVFNTVNNTVNRLLTNEPLGIEVHYSTAQPIEQPIIEFDIVRSDGVLCCSANTRDSQSPVSLLEKNGTIKINAGHLYLTPGIYHLEVSIWDRDMIHPHAISKREIFRIEAHQLNLDTNAVFLPKVHWEINS